MTGATLRQLQWWDEHDYLRPKRRHGKGGHSGAQRWYSNEEVARIRTVVKLRNSNVPMPAAFSIAADYSDESGYVLVLPNGRWHHCPTAASLAAMAAEAATAVRVVEL